MSQILAFKAPGGSTICGVTYPHHQDPPWARGSGWGAGSAWVWLTHPDSPSLSEATWYVRGRQTDSPRDVHILIPGSCEYVTEHKELCRCDSVQDLEGGEMVLGHPHWHSVLTREGRSVTEEQDAMPMALHTEEGPQAKERRGLPEAGEGQETDPTQGFQKEPALRIPGR